MDKGFLVLFKFGKEEHLEAFRRGHMHMRTMRYFADVGHSFIKQVLGCKLCVDMH